MFLYDLWQFIIGSDICDTILCFYNLYYQQHWWNIGLFVWGGVTDFFYSSLPGQHGRHFTDDIFKHIFMNEKFYISIKVSLKFVPKGTIDKKSAVMQVMAWRRTGTKLLPELLLTLFIDAYMQH